jgi:two-component system osmolarity sensor histidine kinase EnvZ
LILRRVMRVSLFWRTFALIGLLIGASLVAWYQIYRAFEREPQTARFAWEIAAIVNLTRAGLVSAAEDRRFELLADLARNEGVRVYPLEPQDRIEPWPDRALGTLIEAKLKEVLGPQTVVASRVNGEKALWISFELSGDGYWLIVDPQRLERQLDGNWLEVSAIGIALATIGALLISRLINGPLSNLARAIDRLSRGRAPRVLPESGPSEISELNRRFNRLASELQSVEDDRAVVLAGISHDIRTPLTRLGLEIEISALPDETKRSMREEIERISGIVKQFVDYARPVEVVSEQIDLARLIDQLRREFARELDEGRLVLKRVVDPGLTWHGDPTLLSRILTNLIDNAVKYGHGHDRPARVDVHARRKGRDIEVSVRDYGPGVPDDAIERLTRPFARLDGARSNVGGSGLGLAIVARLARRAGGDLRLINAPEGGLQAVLTLSGRTEEADDPGRGARQREPRRAKASEALPPSETGELVGVRRD